MIKAGVPVARAKIAPDGTIVVEAYNAMTDNGSAPETRNEWDEKYGKDAH